MGVGLRRLPFGVIALALVLVSCATMGPNRLGLDEASLDEEPRGGGVRIDRFLTQPLSTRPLSAAGAILAPPAQPRSRPLPADETCPALADPGFTARCGIARNGDQALVWLVQTRAEPKAFRAQVLRPTDTGLDVILEAVDENGTRFDDVRGAVADVTGDGNDEISVSFYRKGTRQVLAVDLVQWPGVVGLHREYVQGSARITAGKLEGWEGVIHPHSGMTLSHETITFAEGSWQRTTASSSSRAVHGQDFADPFLLRSGTRYFGYSTNRGPANVPVVTSTDLENWYSLPDALPRLPSWTTRGRVWAPAVLARPGGYVLYYTTRDVATGLQCLSRAHAAAPEGPFADDSTGPFVCQAELGGSIDPSPYVDFDGTPYLVWKSEGVPDRNEPPRLWSQPLSPDGLSLTGVPEPLLAQDREWEAPLIEGPALVRDGDSLYLFYSGGRWQNTTYAVGYATCASPQGPCTKPAETPLLASADDRTGPGGPGGTDVVADGAGNRWMAYHAWVPFEGGYPAGRRMLHLTPVRFVDGRPVLGTGVVAP